MTYFVLKLGWGPCVLISRSEWGELGKASSGVPMDSRLQWEILSKKLKLHCSADWIVDYEDFPV